jgi:hypothetical protein
MKKLTTAGILTISIAATMITSTVRAQEPQGRIMGDATGQEKAVTRTISAFPVPFTDFLHVQLTGYTGLDVTIELVHNNNAVPMVMYDGMYNGVIHLNTASLPAGNYALVVKSRDTFMGAREVMKAHMH